MISAEADDPRVVTDVEGALRREIRQRRIAERVVQRQLDALAKIRELLISQPALPDFIRSVLRAVTNQCGGLWTTLWLIDDQTGDTRRASFQWRDAAIGHSVEAFAQRHLALMHRLGRLYAELIREHGVTILVPVTDPRVPAVVRKFYQRIGSTGALLVPLKIGQKLLGWISHQRGEIDLDRGQIAFVEAMAQQTALAMHLTRLREVERDAERAREGERVAREAEQEHLAVCRLLNVNAHDPADRLGAVLRGTLANATELLHGCWSSLWRCSDTEEIVVPMWLGASGCGERVPPDEALAMAGTCWNSFHSCFEKWLVAEEVLFERVDSPRKQALLAAIGAPRTEDKGAGLAVVPLLFAGESLGFMLVLTKHFPDRTSERTVAVKALAMQAALALSLDEMSSVQRSAALAEERTRIARDLHDLLAQAFSGIALQVEAMRAECEGLPPAVEGRLEKIRNQAGRSAEELRRTLLMLRPTALDQCSLPEALARVARETEANSGIRVRFKNGPEILQLPPRTEQHLFAIVSEALQNALSHAAPTLISISLQRGPEGVALTVANDGLTPVAAARAGHSGHRQGMANIRDRAAEIGARFSFESRGSRARVEVLVPVDSPALQSG